MPIAVASRQTGHSLIDLVSSTVFERLPLSLWTQQPTAALSNEVARPPLANQEVAGNEAGSLL